MNTKRLCQILLETTIRLKKDELPKNFEKVDYLFLKVGVDKAKAAMYRKEFVAILKDWPAEINGASVPKLQKGLTYLQVAEVIGDKEAALHLLAFGKVLGLWTMITPEKVAPVDSDLSRKMAEWGFLAIDNLRLAV